MNKPKFTILIVALAALLLSACGAAGAALTGGADAGGGGAVAGASGQLWADVPRMDGLDASSNQMPMMAEIFMQTIVQASEGAGSGDTAVFTTAKTAADVQAFYTSERMTANGWTTGGMTTCFSGADQGVQDIGLFCTYAKESGATGTLLIIVVVPDDQNSSQNSVFFVRLSGTATATP